jgi:hypothetical protein
MSDPNSDITPKAARPKVNSASQKELDKVEAQCERFDEEVKALTMDRLSATPREETEEPKVSQKQIDKNNGLYLKPKRSMFPPPHPKTGEIVKFNEKFRDEYNFKKEYVNFIFENKEIVGETTTVWTKPYPGIPAEEWEIPTNKPVWAPRYLAEQIKRKFYHRLKMEDRPTGGDGNAQYYGAMAVDTTVQRLDAHPVNNRKSIFMGASGF